MEKQPVDDFFARKLRDAEAPVSPDLFDKMQKRMGAKPLPVRRTTGAWWYVASAACVLIALWFLYSTNRTTEQREMPIAHLQVLKNKEAERIAANQNRMTTELAVKTNVESELVKRRKDEVNKDGAIAEATYPEQKHIHTVIQQPAREPKPISTQQFTERVTVAQVEEKPANPVVPVVATNPAYVERIDRVAAKPKQIAERTIVLTIHEPQAENELIASKIDSQQSDSQGQQNTLSGLFGKLKQLKNGEVLAKVTPTSENHTTQKHRFGRVFTEVKESLKNETTLE